MIEESMKHLAEVKDKKEQLSKTLKELNEQEDYLEQLIISSLRSEGLEKASTDFATTSIKHDIYPNVEDFDKIIKYIMKHPSHLNIIKKSINSAKWRELHEEGVEVPGISTYEKDTLNFRRKR